MTNVGPVAGNEIRKIRRRASYKALRAGFPGSANLPIGGLLFEAKSRAPVRAEAEVQEGQSQYYGQYSEILRPFRGLRMTPSAMTESNLNS